MTTSVKRPMLTPSKQIFVQSLLSNTTSNHFFDSQMKKTLSNKGMRKKHKEQCIKNKRLSDYIYSIANL